MTPHPNPTPSSGNNPSGGSGGTNGNDAPFHTRSTTRGVGGGNSGSGNNGSSISQQRNINNESKTYYQPSVHQFSCRGAFHLQQQQQQQNATKKKDDSKQIIKEDDHDLDALIKDTFLCNGIQTKLRHVADYPLARDKEEAIRWFEGSAAMPGNYGGGGGGAAASNNSAQVHSSDDDSGSGGDGQTRRNDNDEKVMEAVDIEPDSSFVSYGTTQVNILTVQEVPVVMQDNPHHNSHHGGSSSIMDNNKDPFGGFGSIASSGMLNPFGSLFGGFFGGGGGMGDPWSQHPGEEGSDNNNNNNNSGWMKGSRSVSSSTRMDRDENGKRVVTTVTKTTVVDGGGKKRMETVTTERHVDDGGRVETKKIMQTDGQVDKITPSNKQSDGGTNNNHDSGTAHMPNNNGPTPTPRHHPMFPTSSPFVHPPVVPTAGEPTSPAKVAIIATDCLLGMSISDSPSTDPESSITPQSKSSKPSSSNNTNPKGWRKTEYLFKLGRFIPPFMVVGKYYKDEEEEERRRKEMQKEFNDMRESHKKGRWDRSAERDITTNSDGDGKKQEGEKTLPTNNTSSSGTELGNYNNNTTTLSNVSSHTEYYLQRIYVQMIKNSQMMTLLASEVMKPDFPKKVQVTGHKILDNVGPTAERTGKLMKDVWGMWAGSVAGSGLWWGSDNGSGWKNGGGGDEGARGGGSGRR